MVFKVLFYISKGVMKLIDIRGEPQLYQWETGRIIDFDCNVDVIEWETPLLKNALPIKPDAENYTSIPDELLQTSAAITVYAKKNGSVVETATFSVDARKKPLDYIYTPSKVQTLQALADKIAELEKTGGATDEQIENAVEKYLEENPIDVIVSDEQIESVVDKYLEENPPESSGTVKSVRGFKPDENGDITGGIPTLADLENAKYEAQAPFENWLNLGDYIPRDGLIDMINDLLSEQVGYVGTLEELGVYIEDHDNKLNDIPNVYVANADLLDKVTTALQEHNKGYLPLTAIPPVVSENKSNILTLFSGYSTLNGKITEINSTLEELEGNISSGGDTWEFIGEFNVGDEDVSEWIITEDADGNPIELKEMCIHMTNEPATINTGSTNLVFGNPAVQRPFGTNCSYARYQCLRTTKTYQATYIKYINRFENGEGAVLALSSGGTYNASWSMGLMSRGGGINKNCIGGVAMKPENTDTSAIGAGSTIKIWGVRM